MNNLEKLIERATKVMEGVPTPDEVRKTFKANLKNIKDKKAAASQTAKDLGLKDVRYTTSGKVTRYKLRGGTWISAAKSLVTKTKSDKQ